MKSLFTILCPNQRYLYVPGMQNVCKQLSDNGIARHLCSRLAKYVPDAWNQLIQKLTTHPPIHLLIYMKYTDWL